MPDEIDDLETPEEEVSKQTESADEENLTPDEDKYYESIKDQPGIKEKIAKKLGFVPQERYEKVVKSRDDNRTFARTTLERMTVENAEIKRKLDEIESRNQKPATESSESLWLRADEETDPDERKKLLSAAIAAQKAEVEALADAKSAVRIEGLNRDRKEEQFRKDIQALSETVPYAGITAEELDTEFRDHPTTQSEEGAFIYLARKWQRNNPGKTLIDFAVNIAKLSNRSGAPGAPTGLVGAHREGTEVTRSRSAKQVIEDYENKQKRRT